MRVVMTPREQHGDSLVDQARLVATARAQEFQAAGAANGGSAPQRPARFQMAAVLAAMAGNDLVRRVQATQALQEFMHAPGTASTLTQGRLHEMVTAGENVARSARDYIDRFIVTPVEADDAWQQIYTMHGPEDAAQQGVLSGFRVLDITSGITFKKRGPGQGIDFTPVTSGEAFFAYESFGGGVSFETTWWMDQDYMSIGDVFSMFRAAAYGAQADRMYGLLTAIGSGQNFSTGADLIAKLNGAVADIIRKLQGKGANKDLGVNDRSQFLIVAPTEKRAEVMAAMATMSDVAMQAAASKQKLVYNFKLITSPRLSAGGGIYVGLPGGRSKAVVRQDLTLYGQFNISRYADDIAGHMRDRAYLEATQWRRIP